MRWPRSGYRTTQPFGRSRTPGLPRSTQGLLAAEANQRMEELLHGETRWLEVRRRCALPCRGKGGITSEAEEEALEELNDWIEAQGLPLGLLAYDFADPETGEQKAVFDLAWPNGIQEELSQPVAVLLNEAAETSPSRVRRDSGASRKPKISSDMSRKTFLPSKSCHEETQILDVINRWTAPFRHTTGLVRSSVSGSDSTLSKTSCRPEDHGDDATLVEDVVCRRRCPRAIAGGALGEGGRPEGSDRGVVARDRRGEGLILRNLFFSPLICGSSPLELRQD